MVARLSIACLTVILWTAACGPRGSEDVEPFRTTVYAPQNRPDVRGTRGAVSAGHPLAAQAGLDALKRGGTATDAVIAMAGVLAVVRPHMNGIGGDAFGIFYEAESGVVTALNASGRSVAAILRAAAPGSTDPDNHFPARPVAQHTSNRSVFLSSTD